MNPKYNFLLLFEFLSNWYDTKMKGEFKWYDTTSLIWYWPKHESKVIFVSICLFLINYKNTKIIIFNAGKSSWWYSFVTDNIIMHYYLEYKIWKIEYFCCHKSDINYLYTRREEKKTWVQPMCQTKEEA